MFRFLLGLLLGAATGYGLTMLLAQLQAARQAREE
jgi:hypothetical protein